MVEFDAHSLYSRYFSESAKAVSKLFGKIEKLLDESEDTFVCVFIDEIESMATNREHCGKTHEPQDSLRARRSSNVPLIALVNTVEGCERIAHCP